MELIFRQDHRLVCPCQIFQMMTQWIRGNPNSWISNVNHHLKIQISPRLVHTGSSLAKFHKVDQVFMNFKIAYGIQNVPNIIAFDVLILTLSSKVS